MTSRIYFLLPVLLVLAGACATSERPLTLNVTPRQDVPDHFMVGTHTDSTLTEPAGGKGCRNPMVDPRDGTRLILVRAERGQGDYQVPEGKYDMGTGDLLRLECATGKVVGLVKEKK